MRYNQFNQPIGDSLENCQEGSWPDIKTLEGKTVIVEKLNMKHFSDIYEFFGLSYLQNFTYIPLDPFENYDSFEDFFKEKIDSKDPYFFAIVDKASGKAVGLISLMSIDTKNRAIEMGWVVYSNKLKKTRQATEAQYLVMQYVFETLKYRRYQWRCDHFNSPSRNAALRLGFVFEGTFRNAMIYKNRTRDSDFFSITENEWEKNKKRLQTWLSDENFDENGQQKLSLSQIKNI
ncbi:GNAT family acetyltransferase [Neocallimastix lanati (nom. inval.)]|jgi:RimJ/RimL family protein N-acetyltransferase|uniref:GNAT family acetyltransferase n=1 Tax=Neocallimastix californiae TaxID=1754190 RepID=A0A1Y2AN24_9FUNG|nr:GNAT family acetyltransferase [Neocallimastix sp. JGI-2020a]ORY23959.1 GNAT family acetyltransferase [Neocallimastix californiae]|eukprot:ORY23959.1 GNAT family acetyltransferase [Neocallimastix californiae]